MPTKDQICPSLFIVFVLCELRSCCVVCFFNSFIVLSFQPLLLPLFFYFNSEILLYSHFFFILILFLFSYFVTSLINRILKKVSHNSTHPMNKNLHPFNINFEGAFGFLFSLQKIIVFFFLLLISQRKYICN